MNYQKQAQDFATKHGIELIINSSDYKKHFQDDKEERYVFNCTLIYNRKRFTFNFGQSIQAGGEEPTMYDILTCMQKYEIGTFDNFCGDFGYDNDSIKAHKVYKAVVREYKNMLRVFGETILNEMQEIQ
jgi:hypothetical protein